MDQLPRLGKRELICLLLFNCNYVVSVRRGFLFLRVLGMGCYFNVAPLSLPFSYYTYSNATFNVCFRYGNGLISLSKLISGITTSFNTEFQLTQVPYIGCFLKV